MDLPDIMIIAQWGTACSIATLWQHFGRCVRDPQLDGIAVLFTEKENLNPERQRKAERLEKRCAKVALKRKAGKCPRIDDVSDVKKEEEDKELDGDLSNDEGNDKEEKEKEKERQEKDRRPTKTSKKSKKVLDAAVDNIINAEYRGYTCRRVPIMTEFKNDEAGEPFSGTSNT